MLRLTQHPDGVTTEPGDRVVYDVERDEAHYGAAHVDGHALVLGADASGPTGGWLLRCDRVDFPPGGVAYRHTHPGPGLARPAEGQDPDRDAGRVARVRPARVVVRDRPRPRLRRRLRDEETAFVRVLVLPAEWAGKRTIAYVDPADEREAEAPAGADLPRAAVPVSRTGGQLLVDQLAVHGVDIVFGVPGESYLAVLDALHDSPIRLVTCRHEAGAANMAEAYGKLTGRPGHLHRHARPRRDARRRSACTPRSRTRRR